MSPESFEHICEMKQSFIIVSQDSLMFFVLKADYTSDYKMSVKLKISGRAGYGYIDGCAYTCESCECVLVYVETLLCIGFLSLTEIWKLLCRFLELVQRVC